MYHFVVMYQSVNLVPNFEELKIVAFEFRKLLDKCDKQNTELVTEDFPIMSCKLASMLFIYHVLTIWPKLEVYGICGVALDLKDEETISHYWVEIENIAIDLTADQYNQIDDKHLNKSIVLNRPFQPVCVGFVGNISQYETFRIDCRDKYITGFPTIGEDFIHDMQIGHSQLMAIKQNT